MHKVAKFSIENLVQYNNNKNPKKLKFSLDNTPPICYNTDTLKKGNKHYGYYLLRYGWYNR